MLDKLHAEVKAILDATVLFLWPSINPDGQNIVSQWYRGNVGTPFETASTPVRAAAVDGRAY